VRRAGLLVAALLAARAAGAAEIWSRGDARVLIGGEVTGTLGPEDLGFFNYSDYGHSLLRQARLGLSAEVRASERLAVLADVQSENLERPHVYALYLRVRPFAGRRLDLQAGRVPPVFGRFARSGYGGDNPLIGTPLAYQYLTTVRADAVPNGAAGLLAVKGSGWLVGWSADYDSYAAGLPIVAARRWDTGVQGAFATDRLRLSAAVTQGTLGSPRFRDDNDGKQVQARVHFRVSADLGVGVSGARGAYLAREAQDALPDAVRGRSFHQRAAGIDLEYGRGHWLIRAEGVWNAWDAGARTAPLYDEDLTARAVSVEGRYRPWPGVHVAVRADRLDFGDITGPAGREPWEAKVWRLEAGAGYQLTRTLALKAAWQRNRRDGGFVRANDLVAAQASWWF
jgi:predicted porin